MGTLLLVLLLGGGLSYLGFHAYGDGSSGFVEVVLVVLIILLRTSRV